MALRADDVDLDRDRGLVRRFQEGDGEAFSELYRRYYDRLERFCLRRVHDHHTAEEIAQDAFARALTALPDLGGDRRFYPWVSVIASHLCVDWHRRQGRSEPDPDPDPGPVAGGQDAIVEAVDVALALAALGRLAPRHQDVLQLREIEGWSYRHIADHYGVSLGTVETLLFRARHALRREFRLIEGGGLSAIPVLGWAIGRAKWLRVPKWVAAARTPTTVLAAGASATVAAVSFVLIPVSIPPPAALSTPVATAPAATAGRHAERGVPASSPGLRAANGGAVAGAAVPVDAPAVPAVDGVITITDGTAVVVSNSSGHSRGAGTPVSTAADAPAPRAATTSPSSAPGGSLSSLSGPTAALSGVAQNLILPSTDGLTATIAGLPLSVPPVSVPPLTVPPAVGSTVSGITTTVGHVLGAILPAGH